MSSQSETLIIKPSFKIFVVDIVSVVLCFIIAILLCVSPSLDMINYYVAGITGATGVVMFFLVMSRIKAYSFKVTREVVSVNYQFFMVKRVEQVPLEMIGGVAVNQNLIEKILKVAHVDIYPLSSPLKPLVFFGVDKAEQVAQFILDRRNSRIKQLASQKPADKA